MCLSFAKRAGGADAAPIFVRGLAQGTASRIGHGSFCLTDQSRITRSAASMILDGHRLGRLVAFPVVRAMRADPRRCRFFKRAHAQATENP